MSELREPTFTGVWRPELLETEKDHTGSCRSDCCHQGRKPLSLSARHQGVTPLVCPLEMADKAGGTELGLENKGAVAWSS